MCGFSGYINFHNTIKENEQKEIINSSKLLSHRGPDSTKTIIDKKFCVTFHRLSIIETTNQSDQPFHENNGIYLLFNGEIYNYKKLAQKLRSQFKILKDLNSDTKVIYELYKLKGKDFYHELKGMYSIVIIDTNINYAIFLRDNNGIKPLYYFEDQKYGIYFSSELRFFKELLNLSFNKRQIFSFIYMGYTIEPETYLKNVYAIEKNKLLIFFKKIKTYKNKFRESKNTEYLNKEGLISKLENSVVDHCESDVDGSLFISSGYDSYFILKTILKNKDKCHKLKHFININFFEQNKFDSLDKEYHRKYFNSQKLQLHIINYNQNEFNDDVDLFLNSMDQPTIDGINTFVISKIAKNLGIKYALSGLGADELFDGYGLKRKLEWIKFFSIFSKNVPINFLKNISHIFAFKPKVLSIYHNNTIKDYLTIRSLRTEFEMMKIYEEDELKNHLEEFLDYLIKFYYFENQTIFDLDKELYMTNQLLNNTDWISMYNSVEIRVPYVYENIHNNLSHTLGYTKQEVLGDNYDKFFKKKYTKKGFSFPIESYLKENNFIYEGNPLKSWSKLVLDKSFNIKI